MIVRNPYIGPKGDRGAPTVRIARHPESVGSHLEVTFHKRTSGQRIRESVLGLGSELPFTHEARNTVTDLMAQSRRGPGVHRAEPLRRQTDTKIRESYIRLADEHCRAKLFFHLRVRQLCEASCLETADFDRSAARPSEHLTQQKSSLYVLPHAVRLLYWIDPLGQPHHGRVSRNGPLPSPASGLPEPA
jgi:hypothetical protein